MRFDLRYRAAACSSGAVMKNYLNISEPVSSRAEFVRLVDLLGQKGVTSEEAENNRARGSGPRRPRPDKVGLIRIGRTSWFELVKSGVLPKPIKLGRASLWNVHDVLQALQRQGGAR